MKIITHSMCSLILAVTACSSENNNEQLTSENNVDAQNDSTPSVIPPVLQNVDDKVTLDPEFKLSRPASELIRDVIGYKPDQLSGVVPDLADIVIQTAIDSPEMLENSDFVTTDSRFGDVTTSTDRKRFQCSGGGMMIYETGKMRLDDISYTHEREINNYEFDQCKFEVTTDRVVAGNYSANGSLSTSYRSRSGSRFNESAGIVEWTSFELTAPDSLRYEVEGSSSWNRLSSSGNSSDTRDSAFKHYRKIQGITVVDEMTNSDFQMTISYHPVNFVNTMNVSFNASFEDSRGDGRVITVQTSNPLLFSAGFNSDELTQSGQIRVLSSDGGSMTLNAVGSDDRLDPSLNPLVDWTSTSADGHVTQELGVSLGSYGAESEICSNASTETPRTCPDGTFAYILP